MVLGSYIISFDLYIAHLVKAFMLYACQKDTPITLQFTGLGGVNPISTKVQYIITQRQFEELLTAFYDAAFIKLQLPEKFETTFGQITKFDAMIIIAQCIAQFFQRSTFTEKYNIDITIKEFKFATDNRYVIKPGDNENHKIIEDTWFAFEEGQTHPKIKELILFMNDMHGSCNIAVSETFDNNLTACVNWWQAKLALDVDGTFTNDLYDKLKDVKANWNKYFPPPPPPAPPAPQYNTNTVDGLARALGSPQAIHRWICANIRYQKYYNSKYSSTYIIQSHRSANCYDQAKLFGDMCRVLGYKAGVQCGFHCSGVRHCHGYVYINGHKYQQDAVCRSQSEIR